MIIYFYLFIPLVCRLAESSSIKGRNHKNDLVPFLSSRLDTQKDNSLKIVSNEPFIIQFQMPPHSKENVHNGAKVKDKKKKRPDKKRVSKIKPLRKKMRKRRDVYESERREEKPDYLKKLPTEDQNNQNKTQNFISRQEILKVLNMHLKKKETKKLKAEEMKNVKDVEKTDATSSRNLRRNHPSTLLDRDPYVKMIYPNTPKLDSPNYSYKDLISDRERLEQKINYIRNMLNVNDTATEDTVRIRRKSDSDKTANKIAKMFLTLSAVNGLQDKKAKCHDDDDDRVLDIWEKENKKSHSKQSSSSNEERYKVKKWIEYMKSKRSAGKTCPCMNEYNEENDLFPLEQKLAKGYTLSETGASSEESSDNSRDPHNQSRGRPNKSGVNRNNYKEDNRSKLKALANRGKKKFELPTDDLELYRSRAKQILQNAEEILDKIKEEEEKRLAAPHALMSRLRELTSRIQGDPRNNENDLINIIQKNLGWTPQSKSQSNTDNNSFVENMKSFFLDPYEKAKALTDESTRKLSSYLLRNLGKIDSSEEQEESVGKSDQSPQVFHGQVPQTEEMLSANLAKENTESDSMAKEREEHQNWSDTLSEILGGSDEVLEKKNTEDGEIKQTKNQGDSIKRRMEEIIKEQGEKISAFTEKPDENFKNEETTVIDLMAGEQNETPKGNKQFDQSERVEKMLENQNENKEKSEIGDVIPNGVIEKEFEKDKSTAGETGSDIIASEFQKPSEDQTVKEFAESIKKNVDVKSEDDKVRADTPFGLKDEKAAVGEDIPKKDETLGKNLEDNKELESPQTNENQEGDVKDVVMATSEFEKGTSEEKKQALESSKERRDQDENVQSKQDREENDVLNSKHLAQEDDGSEDKELEAFEEEIQLKENPEEGPEETIRQVKPEEYEGTILKKEQDSSETNDPEKNLREINSSPDSIILQKQAETTEETQNEPSSENNNFSTEVVEASQDPKESVEYDDSRKDRPSSEKENSTAELVESEMPENPAQSSVESEKNEDSTEDVVEKAENFLDGEKERIDVASIEKTKSIEEETEREDDTLKSASAGEAEKDDEKLKELNNQNDKEKKILRKSLGDADQDETDQKEPSLKASLDESDNEQKSNEINLQKSLEGGKENLDVSADESSLRSENLEDETLENSNEEMAVKASKQNLEESEAVDETKTDENSLKASKPKNIDEIQDSNDEENLKVAETELKDRENKDEPQVRAEETKIKETDGENEELPLGSKNLEADTERSNESLMNTSGSQEEIKKADDETVRKENSKTESKESTETLKATADEIDGGREETPFEEMVKVEDEVKETKSLEDGSREANMNEEESIEINKTPKLLMRIKEGSGEEKETAKTNQKEGNEENRAIIGDTWNATEEDNEENTNTNDEVPVKAENPEADQERSEEVQDTQEMDDKDDINARTEHIKNLDNQVDESLKYEESKSAKAKSEELNEDPTLKLNSLERKVLSEDDVVEGVDRVKEVTVGKKKNKPASEGQNYEQNQSKSTLKVPKSIGKIMRDLDGKEKDDYVSLTKLNPEKIDQIIDKIDEAENQNKLKTDVDCRKECACADEMNTRSRNIGRYEIVKDFLHWVKDLQLNRILTDD